MDITDRTMLAWLQDRQKKMNGIEIDQINIEGYIIHGGQKESFSVSISMD